MPKLDEAPILELGKTPIPGPSPAGADAADDEQYIFCSKQVAKIGRLDADAENPNPDWYGTEQAATNLLRSKVKDVEVASWLGWALFQRVGYAGLSCGIALISELVRNFWDGMQPERPRRRKARIESLCDQFATGIKVADGGWFKDNQPKPDDFDALDQILARIDELKTLLTEKMPDDPPDFSKFTRCAKELAGQRPKPQAAAAPAAPAAGGTPAAAGGGGGGGSFSAGDVKDVSGAANAILAAAAFVRKTEPTDPLSYAVVRVMKWTKIALPPSGEARVQLESPDKTVVEALQHQMANGVWDHLLNNAESAFRSGDPLWLDLQRYTCSAMANLGPQYEKARQAVMAQTGALVRRLGDGLYELKFKSGQALCSGETKMWIEAEVAPPQKAGGGGAGMSNGKLTEASDNARKLAGTGKLKEGLQVLQDGLQTCVQRRDRFLWRLRIAQLCYDAKKFQVAAPLLEECFEEAQRYHIAEWEPSLAVEAAEALYRCRKAMTPGDKAAPEALQSVRESFSWLCQLDPVAALAAEPAGG